MTFACVAGVSAPAFVERSNAPAVPCASCPVSPGSRPRPSLSVLEAVSELGADCVVAGSRPR